MLIILPVFVKGARKSSKKCFGVLTHTWCWSVEFVKSQIFWNLKTNGCHRWPDSSILLVRRLQAPSNRLQTRNLLVTRRPEGTLKQRDFQFYGFSLFIRHWKRRRFENPPPPVEMDCLPERVFVEIRATRPLSALCICWTCPLICPLIWMGRPDFKRRKKVQKPTRLETLFLGLFWRISQRSPAQNLFCFLPKGWPLNLMDF